MFDLHPRSRRLTLVTAASAASLVTVLGLSGCQSSAQDTTASAHSTGSPEAFINLLRSDLSDYDPASSPEELGDEAALVVRGNIVDVVKGRTFGDPDSVAGASETAVMHVQVRSVLQGELPDGSDNIVYVEFFGLGDPQEVADAAPDDAGVLMYLTPVGDESLVPGEPESGEGRGYPDGQPLFTRVSPQGLYMETSGGVTQVTDSIEYPDASLSDFQPTDSTFPPTPEAP